MAPLKFEDKVREKLEQRTIQPSKESWKKLEQFLDKNEEKKKTSYWWLGIAAGFVGILLVGTIFVKSDGLKDNPAKNYVNTTEKIIKKEEENKTQLVEAGQTEKIEEINNTPDRSWNNEIIEKNKPDPSLATAEQTSQNYDVVVKKKTDQTNMVTTNDLSKKVIKTQDAVYIDSVGIKEKVIAIAAQVKELERRDVAVTDEEITKLLLQAQREITTEQILTSNKVSASSLLSEVESELDETFKEKVFEALKTGFQKLKSSVVQRDN